MNEILERAAKAIKAKVPIGYGMTHAEAIEYARAAIEAMKQPTDADKPATTVYGDLLWRHMDACRKHGVPSHEQDRLFKLSEEFRAVYPDECKVWEDRYPGDAAALSPAGEK